LSVGQRKQKKEINPSENGDTENQNIHRMKINQREKKHVANNIVSIFRKLMSDHYPKKEMKILSEKLAAIIHHTGSPGKIMVHLN
jgi:translation initiation factor 2 beta subunit (eIF-2beta)/eIF-5